MYSDQTNYYGAILSSFIRNIERLGFPDSVTIIYNKKFWHLINDSKNEFKVYDSYENEVKRVNFKAFCQYLNKNIPDKKIGMICNYRNANYNFLIEDNKIIFSKENKKVDDI